MVEGERRRAQVLSNGRLAVQVGEEGGGSAWLEGVALARWPALAFVRDLATGREVGGSEPPDEYGVEMTGGTAVLRRVVGELVTTVEVCVSPFDDVELLRLTVRNQGGEGGGERRLEVGVGRELLPLKARSAAAPPPALELEPLVGSYAGGVLVTRPARNEDEDGLFLVQRLGRPRGGSAGAGAPARLERGAGSAIELSLELRLGPGEGARLLALTGVAVTREDAEALLQGYGMVESFEQAFGAADERARNLLADLRIPQGWAERIPALTGQLLRGDRRPAPGARAVQRQAGFEGSAPLVLGQGAEAEALAGAVAMARYWRRQSVPVDLLVLAPGGAQADVLREMSRAPAPKWLGSTLVAAPGELADDVVARLSAAAVVHFDGVLAGAAARV